MKHTAERFFGASMVILAELLLVLALLSSASLSLLLTHLFLVKFRPPFLYLVLCGKYKHTLKNTLKRVLNCVISNGVEVGREELKTTEWSMNGAMRSFNMLYMNCKLGNYRITYKLSESS